MRSSLQLVKLVVLIVYVRPVSGGHCYVCRSLEETRCGELFLLTRNDSGLIQQCSTSCFKFLAMKDERPVVSRGCLPEIKTMERCFTDTAAGGYYGEMCTCNDELCNTASRMIRNTLWLVWSFGVPLLLSFVLM